jgi:hypothetical protein
VYVIAHNGARIWGGAERATTLILAGLRHRGHRVLLLCNDPLVADRARALHVPAELQPLGGDVAIHHAAALARRLAASVRTRSSSARSRSWGGRRPRRASRA